jgi:hypothetical protein
MFRTYFVIGTAMLTTLLVGCGTNPMIAQVRYRVTATFEVDGEPKTATTVHGIQYRWQGYGGGGRGHTILALSKGSAPLVDLGRYGMLALSAGALYGGAAFDQGTEWAALKRRGEAHCNQPALLTETFNKIMRLVDKRGDLGSSGSVTTIDFMARLAAMPKGIQGVDSSMLPAFIWFPAQSSFMKSRLVCPSDFNGVIGRSVELKSVTVEVVANETPIDHRITQTTPWLSEMREVMRDFGDRVKAGDRSKVGNDAVKKAYERIKQLETDLWP